MSTSVRALAAAAPVNFDRATVDWTAFGEVLREEGVGANDLLAASWCTFGTVNIEALVDASTLAVVHAAGLIASTGKRKMIGRGVKYSAIHFDSCRQYGPVDHEDPRGLGKFCIEFGGPGGVLLGRLQWTWKAKRFRDSRPEIMAVAEERDRMLEVVRKILG